MERITVYETVDFGSNPNRGSPHSLMAKTFGRKPNDFGSNPNRDFIDNLPDRIRESSKER